MDKRDLAANADETLAQPYPTPTADGQAGASSFYHATGADVGLDQIDPQLEGMQTDEGRGDQLDDSVETTEANVQALVAAVGNDNVDVGMGSGADESYPESHLRALKTEDTGHHDGGGGGGGGAYVDATQAGHNSDENNMYAAAALEHVQQAAAAQQAEGQDSVDHHEHQQHQQHQQPHEQEHNQGHDQHQQGVRAPVSVEELQLAAQLSQGLAPMMREANARREGEFHDVNNGVNNGVGGVADGGAGLHDDQDDAEVLRVAAAAAAAAAADGAYGSPDVASAYHHTLQHPADVQGHAGYADTSQAVGHLPASLQMAQIAQQYNVDHIPPRKRSKVSRACDACRRKKIKCDSVSETEQCTNCRRARTECLFSRVPQKRGPSKGYIKELADRINSIEGKLGNQSPSSAADALELLGRSGGDAGDAGNGYARYSLNENAKRPYASMSADTPDGSPANSNRHAAWATTTPRTSNLFQTPAGSAAAASRTPYSAVSLAPQPQIDAETPNVLSRSLTDMERLLPLADHESQELDDAVFSSYLTAVHPCLPFLPSDRSRVLDNLSQCPQFLQDAFVVALRAVADALGSVPTAGLARVASALLAQWETEGSPRTSLHDLVHLQTLLLLAVEADTHGPAALKGHHGGLSKTALLSRAVAVSYEMDLPQEQLGATAAAISAAAAGDPSQSESVDTDSEARLGLRAWWSLVVLDRWNAVALGKALLIPLRTVVLSPGLRPLLGESAFQFTKLSYLLGSSLAPALVSTDPLRQLQTSLSSSSSAAFLGPLGQQLDLGLEMWRADLPDAVTESAAPLVHLGYWQYRLLTYLLQPSALSSDVSWATKKVVELTLVATDAKAVSRRGPGPPISPFHHYFICLSGLILAELSKVANERQAALRTLNDLLEVVAPKPIPVEGGAEGATEIPNSSVWNGPLRETLARRLKSSPSSNSNNNSSSTTNTAAVAAAAVAAAAAAAAAVEAAVTATEGDAAAAANNDSAAGPAKLTAPPAPTTDDSLLRGATNFENLGFNPLALLRGGFLNTVHKTAVVTTAPEANVEGTPTPQEAVQT